MSVKASGQIIHLVAHDWHTGLIVPSKDVCAQIPQLKYWFGDTPYLEFGWGDRRYYQSESSSLPAKLLAILIPSDSTIQVVAVPEHPEHYYADKPLAPIGLEDNGYCDLVNFISNSFYKSRRAEIIWQANGPSGDSQFYKARGWYHLFNTCNKWTAKGLQVAGLKISPGFKLTAESVIDVAKKMGTAQSMTAERHSKV